MRLNHHLLHPGQSKARRDNFPPGPCFGRSPPKELRSLSPVESSRSVCSPSVPPSAAIFISEPYIPVRAPKRGDAIPARHLCIRVRRFWPHRS